MTMNSSYRQINFSTAIFARIVTIPRIPTIHGKQKFTYFFSLIVVIACNSLVISSSVPIEILT